MKKIYTVECYEEYGNPQLGENHYVKPVCELTKEDLNWILESLENVAGCGNVGNNYNKIVIDKIKSLKEALEES